MPPPDPMEGVKGQYKEVYLEVASDLFEVFWAQFRRSRDLTLFEPLPLTNVGKPGFHGAAVQLGYRPPFGVEDNPLGWIVEFLVRFGEERIIPEFTPGKELPFEHRDRVGPWTGGGFLHGQLSWRAPADPPYTVRIIAVLLDPADRSRAPGEWRISNNIGEVTIPIPFEPPD